MKTKSDDEMLDMLCEGFMRFWGWEEAKAVQAFTVICKGWSISPENLPRLVHILLAPEHGLGPNEVLMWLYLTVPIMQTKTGRRLFQQAAKGAARIDRGQAAPSN